MSAFTEIDPIEVGRRLGHDLFHYRFRAAELDLQGSVAEGYHAAMARGARIGHTDRYQRKWLQLRMGAYRRGRAFDEGVTPDCIRSIDVSHCPVMRIELTHGERVDSDWSIDRLNNDGAYVANNLAVLSCRANRAKGAKSFADVHGLALLDRATEGLRPVEWMRMAALMLGPCFAPRPSEVPALPLNVPIPNGTVRLALQQIQHVFHRLAGTQKGKNVIIKQFRVVSEKPRSELLLRQLAERVHVRSKGLPLPCDVWLENGVMDALTAWWTTLDASSRGRAGEVSRVLAGARQIPVQRLQSWRLETRGYV